MLSNMITPVTANTINNLNPDAGMLLFNFDFTSATDAPSLMALIASTEGQKCWFGATKGGINVQENREWWSPTFDGKRMPFKGEKRFSTANPKMTGTLVEFRPENVKAVSGIADIGGEGTKITVQPKANIRIGDYFDNVVFVCNNGPEGLYVAEMKNALCTSGLNSQSTDKDIGTLPFEFSGHSDSVVFTEDLPLTYYFFGVSKEAAEQVAQQVANEEDKTE